MPAWAWHSYAEGTPTYELQERRVAVKMPTPWAWCPQWHNDGSLVENRGRAQHYGNGHQLDVTDIAITCGSQWHQSRYFWENCEFLRPAFLFLLILLLPSWDGTYSVTPVSYKRRGSIGVLSMVCAVCKSLSVFGKYCLGISISVWLFRHPWCLPAYHSRRWYFAFFLKYGHHCSLWCLGNACNRNRITSFLFLLNSVFYSATLWDWIIDHPP